MKASYSAHNFLLITIAVICAASLCSPAEPAPLAASLHWVELPNLNISLQIPAAWDVEMFGGHAARLLPSTGEDSSELWPIELVVWTTPAPKHSPEQAVAGHEKLLMERYDYRRESTEPFTGVCSWPGVFVTGRIDSNAEITLVVLLAGYGLTDRSLVVGTFCRPEQKLIVQGLFQRIARSIAPLGVHPLPASVGPEPQSSPSRTDRAEASAPASVCKPPATTAQTSSTKQPSAVPSRIDTPEQSLPLPRTDRAPSAPMPRRPVQSASAIEPHATTPSHRTPVPPGQVQDLTEIHSPRTADQTDTISPQTQPPPPAQWVRHASPAGIAVRIPNNWTVTTHRGVFHARSPAGTPGIMVCPLLRVPAITSEKSGQSDSEILQYWQWLTGGHFISEHRLNTQRGSQGIQVTTGTLEIDSTAGRATVVIAQEGPIALLTVAYGPAERFPQAVPWLSQILEGVSLGRFAATMSDQLQGKTERWTSADGQLTGQVPAGWQVQGDIKQYNGHTVIHLQGSHAGDAHLRFAWHQPHTPFFRELTPLLRGLGRLPGEQYQERGDNSPLVIMSKSSAQQFAMHNLLERTGLHRGTAQIISQAPCDSAKRLVEGGNSSGMTVELAGQTLSGLIRANYVVATADLPVTEGSFCWMASYLMWAGSEDLIWAARHALHTVLSTAELAETGVANNSLQEMMEAARSAFGGAAPAYSYRFVPLLSDAFRPQAAGPVVVPRSLLAYWADSNYESP